MPTSSSAATQPIRLDQTKPSTAKEINSIMQAAYRVEADLLSVEDFHPLKRSIDDISASKTEFYGINFADHLAAVIEFEELEASTIEINSLVVKPSCFRQGLGRQLLEHLFSMFPVRRFLVSTGIKNLPAVRLYQSLGFTDSSFWQTPCGIDMISLTRTAKTI